MICLLYFSGLFCPHCAHVDPVLFPKLSNVTIVIDYEFHQLKENGMVLYGAATKWGVPPGVPLLISDHEYAQGDAPILSHMDEFLSTPSNCPLPNRTFVDWSRFDPNSLPGLPKIWTKDRFAFRQGYCRVNATLLKGFLTSANISPIVSRLNATKPEAVSIAGGKRIGFKHAARMDCWLLEWNDNVSARGEDQVATGSTPLRDEYNRGPQKVSLVQVTYLALSDAVNPCTFAVLTILLISIASTTYDRRRVLLAGIMFTAAVFIGYLIYGVLLVQFFQLLKSLTFIRQGLYALLGLAAIGLGILQIKDFFFYKPGGFLTEMPMSWRPHVKKMLSSISSPKTAFMMGIICTVFLLPCSIGPYVITGGIISALDMFRAMMYLVYYNMIFVMPLLGIVLLVYWGIKRAEEMKKWRDENVKWMHLVAGILLVLVGVMQLM